MQLRLNGQDATPEDVARCYGLENPFSDIVLFIHGLMADDECWRIESFNMTEALTENLDIFPVHVSYNTGRHVSENGQELAHLLEKLLQEIPGFSRALHIVAHSMGGLVARSSLHQAENSGMAFLEFVDKVFFLATLTEGPSWKKVSTFPAFSCRLPPIFPFGTRAGSEKLFENIPVGEGSSLAPVGEIADFFIRKVPTFYIKLADRILDMRSDGIRDLRYGYLVREEWDRKKNRAD